MLRKPSTIEGLACALFSEKGIESRKVSGRLKVEHPFLIVKRRFDPLRKRYRRIEKMSAHSSLSRPCKPYPCASFAGRLHLPAPRVA
ncbi:hypothetical protein [Atopobium sp. oral taxon 416]|uniref:hypothetical protein n=1 Tax=Atopobium sp. oral taxon 416 TaxID=712157 RepID=UPI001BA4D5C8|nr:hypothetical protein [Atopobium sp. oral taxon 416]QUC04513.1 hypothetical protein J4859_06210 [Atopobium sp. oral taxon 416]